MKYFNICLLLIILLNYIYNYSCYNILDNIKDDVFIYNNNINNNMNIKINEIIKNILNNKIIDENRNNIKYLKNELSYHNNHQISNQTILRGLELQIPDDTSCEPTIICSKWMYCSIVCERGTVEIEQWLKFSLKQQNKISRTNQLCYSYIPGTHNSAITMAEGYGNDAQVWNNIIEEMENRWPWADVVTEDQYFTLTDQMNLGVRMVEMDVHWIHKNLYLAHCGGMSYDPLDKKIQHINKILEELGFSFQITWDSETIGCLPSFSGIPALEQRLFSDGMKEIKNWSDNNKDEFIIVMLDDELDDGDWDTGSELVNEITSIIDIDNIYTPKDLMNDGGNLMNFPTIDYIVNDLKKNFIFVSRQDYGKSMKSVIFVRDNLCNWVEPGLSHFYDYPNCSFNGIKTNQGQFIRVETSEIQYGPLDSNGKLRPNEYILNDTTLPPIVSCNVNLPCGDFITPTRSKALIWTWAEGEYLNNNNEKKCPILNIKDSRWYYEDCNNKYHTLCLDNISKNIYDLSDKNWSFGNPTTYENAINNCKLDSSFSLPTRPIESKIIQTLMLNSNINKVWINLNDF